MQKMIGSQRWVLFATFVLAMALSLAGCAPASPKPTAPPAGPAKEEAAPGPPKERRPLDVVLNITNETDTKVSLRLECAADSSSCSIEPTSEEIRGGGGVGPIPLAVGEKYDVKFAKAGTAALAAQVAPKKPGPYTLSYYEDRTQLREP